MWVTLVCSVALLLLWVWRCVRAAEAASVQKTAHRNILHVEPSFFILKLFRRMQYMWNGPEMLLQAHVQDTPYAIRTPETYQIHFTSETHIKELLQAPDTHLSLHALGKDMFQPKYTMNGLGVEDTMSANGTIHQRAIQVELRSHLPTLQQPLSDCIAAALHNEITSGKALAQDWKKLQIFPAAKRIITAANALVFFGPEVSNDPSFLQAAMEYPEHLMETAEVLRLIPSCLAPYAAPHLMRGHHAIRTLLDRLTPIVERRLQKRSQQYNYEAADPNPSTTPDTSPSIDCIQFFVNAVVRKQQQTEWPAQRIVQVLLGIWFASVHQPAMCLFYALDDLCKNPEFVDVLREEAALGIHDGMDIDTLPLLDGFLKESARLHPTDSISVRRKVVQPFTFQDGTCLARDDVACVPLQPILRNPLFYEDPLAFNPYRFMDEQAEKKKVAGFARFTDADMRFPVWGLGKRAW